MDTRYKLIVGTRSCYIPYNLLNVEAFVRRALELGVEQTGNRKNPFKFAKGQAAAIARELEEYPLIDQIARRADIKSGIGNALGQLFITEGLAALTLAEMKASNSVITARAKMTPEEAEQKKRELDELLDGS